MNVFVTGGAGYIGSVYVEEALRAGHAVTVYDNLSEGHREAIDPRATFIEAELSDEAQVLDALHRARAEVIVHFAANALVGESMSNPGKYFGNNVGNGVKLLNSAVAAGVRRFVFSSTCATYGPPERVPMTEDLPQRPINPYGESKLMFEKILGWYRQIHGLEFVAFRYFNAAGANPRCGEHHRIETHLIPNVLKVALGQASHCEIYGTDYPTTSATAKATRCGKSSTCARRSPAPGSGRRRNRAGRETRRASSPPRTRRNVNWAGHPDSRSSKTSFGRPGNGTGSIRGAIRIED